MDHHEAGRFWNDNADAWTKLARAGFDVYRDHLNTPAFFALLPDVKGMEGVDIGCGEGHNTRLLADRGARMSAVDISEKFIAHAKEAQTSASPVIDYHVASAVQLPFAAERFDFATGFMSFMDVPETDRVLAEAHRVLKPGGFLQFSITHPCFDTPHRRNLRDSNHTTYAIEIGGYFHELNGAVSEWIFGGAPIYEIAGLKKFKTPRFNRTISQWINLVIDAGFVVERLAEPRPDDATVQKRPDLQDAQVVAYFLHVRARKPSAGPQGIA
jgi:ubiquinone/menaquinone biosynthesis C-methylase UbiE